MNLAEYARYDGLGLAELVRRRQVTSKQLGSLFLAAVEKVNPMINAVIEAYSDRVDGQDESAVPQGPFAGVPFLMKDLGATEKGKRQECGSRLMKGSVADKDSLLTMRFKQAGLVLLGRSAVPEFGMADTTESILNGATRNPWNLAMIAGGSSGGAAASVAAGVLPLAMASDAGGSIRIPASACGLVGLKPSRGRVTVGPDAGELWAGLIQEFVLSRTVRDSAVMLDAVSQPAPGDPFIITQPRRPYVQELNSPLGELRIAWTVQSWQPETVVHPEVVRCVEQVVAQCERLDQEVVEASPVLDFEEYMRAFCVVQAFGFDVTTDALAARMGRRVNEETLEPLTLAMYRYAQQLTVADWISADSLLNKLRRSFGRFFQDYDLLLTPTLAQTPGPLGKYALTRADLDFVAFQRLNSELDMYLPSFNITGQPAISLPLGETSSGLPIGVQFVAKFAEEADLIRLASALEQAMPWSNRLPTVHVSR